MTFNPKLVGDDGPFNKARAKRMIEQGIRQGVPLITPAEQKAPFQIRFMYKSDPPTPIVAILLSEPTDKLVFDLEALRTFMQGLDKAGEDCQTEWMKKTPCIQCGYTLDRHQVEVSTGANGEEIRTPVCPVGAPPPLSVAPGTAG